MVENSADIFTPDTPSSAYLARVAVYDSLLAAPRVIDIQETGISDFIERIATTTYTYAKQLGGVLPFTVIHEISENFIHAYFKECTVSILDSGNTIRFSDQGPGIQKKKQVLEPGVTSATQDMKRYIKGVGSGFPIVNEFLQTTGGYLLIDDNATTGSIITIAATGGHGQTILAASPRIQNADIHYNDNPRRFTLDEREHIALSFIYDNGVAGPTELAKKLELSTATALRSLRKLEDAGLIESTPNKKRIVTNAGVEYLNNA